MSKYLKLSSFLLLFIITLFLVACNSFNSIKNDFEKAGYTYSVEAQTYIEDVLKEFEEEEVFVKPHVFSKGLNIAIVLEFKNTKSLQEKLNDSATLRGFIEDMRETDIVRGNCLLIPLGTNPNEMIQIFQGNYTAPKS